MWWKTGKDDMGYNYLLYHIKFFQYLSAVLNNHLFYDKWIQCFLRAWSDKALLFRSEAYNLKERPSEPTTKSPVLRTSVILVSYK